MKSKNKDNIPFMNIGIHRCSSLEPTLLIAEEGQANQGDVELALKMIDLASECGADGIEFQLSVARDLYISTHEGYHLYKEREFAPDVIEELIRVVHSKNMLFQAACLSERLVEIVAEKGADVLVSNATDLNNPRMLDALSACGKPFFIATLMGTMEEIDWAVSRVRRNGATNFGLLHGQHIMGSKKGIGVPVEYAQLDCMSVMEQRYGVPVGFVDHTDSEIMPAIASSRGAVVVAKHLAPEPGWRGPDWQVCLDPRAWARAVDYLQYANDARGADKELSVEEIQDRSLMRRSIVAARDIPPGKALDALDMAFKRPGGGLDPRNYERYIGQRVKISVQTDEMITEEILE